MWCQCLPPVSSCTSGPLSLLSLPPLVTTAICYKYQKLASVAEWCCIICTLYIFFMCSYAKGHPCDSISNYRYHLDILILAPLEIFWIVGLLDHVIVLFLGCFIYLFVYFEGHLNILFEKILFRSVSQFSAGLFGIFHSLSCSIGW